MLALMPYTIGTTAIEPTEREEAEGRRKTKCPKPDQKRPLENAGWGRAQRGEAEQKPRQNEEHAATHIEGPQTRRRQNSPAP